MADSIEKNGHLNFLRNTLYYVQSEPVVVAPDYITEDVAGKQITLDKLYDGLESGRLIIVAGERTDIKDANDKPLPGIRVAELRTVGAIESKPDPDSPGDRRHTVLSLDKSLDYSYKRSSVVIYGNVVEASHGETIPSEVLGSGNAAVAMARFLLKRPPLTYVSAPTTSGVQSTEVVRVNNVRYQRVNSLLDAKDSDRVYELADDENGAATLTFGSRLPTGQENVRASYRLGIGAEGNVKEGQISQLVSRPLGVQGVVNPIKSSGGADRDGPERIRRNLSLATKGLGPSARLVSVDDYASFALQFAGIGHAQAQKLAGGWVHVTVAGVDDIPLDEEGALLTNLKIAYRKFGDPALQVAMSVRELKALVIDAKVFVDPDAELSTVEANLRARLLDRFSFERSLLGKSIYLSDVVATMQEVSGVDWVDVDLFAGISENELLSDSESAPTVGKLKLESQVICVAATLSRDDPVRKKIWDSVIGKAPRFLPAQLAYFVPQVPRTIVLNISPSSGR